MIRTFIIAAFLAAGSLHGAIKKAPDSKPDPTPAPEAKPQETPKPAEKPKPSGKGVNELLDELRKSAEDNGGMLNMDAKELLSLLRSVLEKQGVPADKLKKAELPELLRLMKEKNPDAFNGLGLGGPPALDKASEKKLTDHFNQLLEGHRPGSLVAARATFVLRDAKKPSDPLAFATGIRADGWLLTKASEVGTAAELQCQIKGQWIAAKVVRTWPDHDLALLKADAKDLPAVKWGERGALEVGTFITAAAPEGREPVAIGVVSVAVRNEQTKGRGFLGVQLESDDKGLKIRDVVPKGPAQNSGLQKEDLILELDGKKPESVYTFTKLVSDRKAGEKIKLKLQRGEAVMEKEVALGDRGAATGPARSSNDKMNSMGSTISKRRTDFPAAMQTDLPLNATQCGGPVTDLDGNIVGIVIARSGRIETQVLPSETIREVLDRVDFSKEGQAPTPAPAVAKTEAPKKETPKVEAPKTEVSNTEKPKAEVAIPAAKPAPKTEAPKAEIPKAEVPKTEAPKSETPKADAPKPAAAEKAVEPAAK